MIIEALFYLHTQHNVIHCDIKPDNILFTQNCDSSDIKLIDFGMAKILSPPFTSYKQICGTPYYTAPEVIKCNYSYAADMWSVGALLFTMIFGYPAFYVDINKYVGIQETYQIYKIIKKGFNPQIKNGFGAWFPKQIVESKSISPQCMDLITNLMIRDVTKRLTAKEVLQHQWITGSILNIDLFGLSLANFTVSHQSKYMIASLYEQEYNLIRSQYVNKVKQLFYTNGRNKDKISYQEFEGIMIKCNKLQLNKDQIRRIFNEIDVNKSGFLYFKQILNAVIYDHLISQDERYLRFLNNLKNEDIENILKCVDNDHIDNYDAFLAAIHPKKVNFTFICNKSYTLLINGYINGFKTKFKFDKNICLDICGVIQSFYDKNMHIMMTEI